MLRFLCLVAALFSLASGFTVAPALRGASSQPAVRMAAAPLRTNDMVKVISGDDKVRAAQNAADLNTLYKPQPCRAVF